MLRHWWRPVSVLRAVVLASPCLQRRFSPPVSILFVRFVSATELDHAASSPTRASRAVIHQSYSGFTTISDLPAGRDISPSVLSAVPRTSRFLRVSPSRIYLPPVGDELALILAILSFSCFIIVHLV